MTCIFLLLLPLMTFKRSYLERIGARVENVEGFDKLARDALEERKLRYEEWKDRKPKPAPPTGIRFWSKLRDMPAPTGSTMVAAYDLAGQSRVFPPILLISSNSSQRPSSQAMCQQSRGGSMLV